MKKYVKINKEKRSWHVQVFDLFEQAESELGKIVARYDEASPLELSTRKRLIENGNTVVPLMFITLWVGGYGEGGYKTNRFFNVFEQDSVKELESKLNQFVKEVGNIQKTIKKNRNNIS